MPSVHVATFISFLLMRSLAVRPFQSELTETVETDAMDTSDGPNQDTYVQMAKLAGASYKNEDVPGWKKLGDPAIRPKNFDALGGDTKYLATLYEHRKRYECTLAFSGTDQDDAQDIWRDVLVPPDGLWCQMKGIHRGFAEAMDFYWKNGGKEQVKKLITSKDCKDNINAVGHSLGGAKAALLAACANSRNGWLDRQLSIGRDLEEVTGDCVKVCGYDTLSDGKCKKTSTNPIGRRAGTFKNVRKVSDRRCCAGWWGPCISCCKMRPTEPSWPEVKVYTFGAPAIASGQLQNNRRGDHCFQGARFFNYDDILHHDTVPSMATAFAHRHPKMQAFELSGDIFGKIGASLGPTRSHIKCSDGWSASAPSSWLRAALKVVSNFLYASTRLLRAFGCKVEGISGASCDSTAALSGALLPGSLQRALCAGTSLSADGGGTTGPKCRSATASADFERRSGSHRLKHFEGGEQQWAAYCREFLDGELVEDVT